MRILICDDEVDVTVVVAELVRRAGIEADTCTSGAEALRMLAARPYDLVVLDIMMPGMDGYRVCQRIRATSEVPIIFLTARDAELDQVLGFSLGADDYVVKPFKARELVARIKAHLRRARRDVARSGLIETAGITCDLAAHTAELDGEELPLTAKEFDVLVELVRAGGDTVPANALYERAWHERPCAQSRNSVMVYIRRLRRKLQEAGGDRAYIDTVWGVGYRIHTTRRQEGSDGKDA